MLKTARAWWQLSREIRLPGALSAAESCIFGGFCFSYSYAGHDLCWFAPAAVIVMGTGSLAGGFVSNLSAYRHSSITRARLQEGWGFMCGAWRNPLCPCFGGHFTQPGPGAVSAEPVDTGIGMGRCCSRGSKGSPLQEQRHHAKRKSLGKRQLHTRIGTQKPQA